MSQKVTDAICLMEEVACDNTIPKNIRQKMRETICHLQEDCELEIKSSKAIEILDSLSEDVNLPSYTRAQIWSIVSLLESNEI